MAPYVTVTGPTGGAPAPPEGGNVGYPQVGPVADVSTHPRYPYTRALLAAMPTMDPSRRTTEALLSGDPPNLINPPSGCRFRTRCRFAEEVCARREPPLSTLPDATDHTAACHMLAPDTGHSLAPAGGARQSR